MHYAVKNSLVLEPVAHEVVQQRHRYVCVHSRLGRVPDSEM